MLMAIDTGEEGIVGSVAVTFGATVPFTIVTSRIYGKKQSIMNGEGGRFPSGHSGVTLHAHVVNSGRDMVGIGGGNVIGLMAGETIGRYTGIVALNMAKIAVI
jgi:hypothetical protein